ncbi:unnamed protein product [Allacma fusca]|uniref:Cytochrome P450 n=1 Tax=Allacma fusca TaxID=39272 RepID=A0A8J2KAL3_9HEXA|nr:unnamed protein product [Allacma fusca]
MTEWTKEYGPIFQIYFGSKRTYVLSELKSLREVFNDSEHNDRPYNEALYLLRDGLHGVVASSGQEWVEQRRFTLRHLRDFGFGKMAGEELIMFEVNDLLSKFSKDVGNPVSLSKTFNMAILNILWRITTGNRYEQDDPQLWSIFDQRREFQLQLGKNPAIFFVPSLAKAFPNFFGWNVVLKMLGDIKQILIDHVDEHQRTYSQNDPPRDFMDVYLAEIYKTTDTNSSFYKDHGLRSLRAIDHRCHTLKRQLRK